MRPLHWRWVQAAAARFRPEGWCPRAQHWIDPSLGPDSACSDPWLHAQADRPPELAQTGSWGWPLTEPVAPRACSAPSLHARADRPSELVQTGLWGRTLTEPGTPMVCSDPSPHARADKRSDPLQLQEQLGSFEQALPAPLLELRVCNVPSRHVLAHRSPAEASIEPAQLPKPVAAGAESAEVGGPAYNGPWLHARADRQTVRLKSTQALFLPRAAVFARVEPARACSGPWRHAPEGKQTALTYLRQADCCALHVALLQVLPARQPLRPQAEPA